MFVSHISLIEKIKINMEGAKDAYKQVLVGKKEGWDNYVMRLFTIKSYGNTPKHQHNWPHINYVIEGEGILTIDNKKENVKKGSIAFVPPNKEHQYTNTSKDDFIFICIVPKEGDK